MLVGTAVLFFSAAGPAASGAPEPLAAGTAACAAYSRDVAALLDIGATALQDAGRYAPLIDQAAEAGIHSNSAQITLIVKRINAIDADIATQTGRVKATTRRAVTDAKACRSTSPACGALTAAGGRMLGVLATASGDAAGYRPLIEQAADAGHARSASKLAAIAQRERAITAQLREEDRKLTALRSQVLSDGGDCSRSPPATADVGPYAPARPRTPLTVPRRGADAGDVAAERGPQGRTPGAVPPSWQPMS